MKRKIIAAIFVVLSMTILYTYFNKLLNNEKYITINDKGGTENKELEEYIIGVVACEMPALYHDEALKAQSIAARTYALYKANLNLELLTTTSDQCYITETEMKKKWGNDYNKYYNKIKDIVYETAGIIMTKDNKLFKSFYFSTSNGYTESSQTVFKEANLNSVSSPWDIDTKNYYKEVVYTKEDLISILGEFTNIKIVSKSKTNHVEKVSVDNKIYTGVEFRKLLNLRSKDFNITKKDNKYYIETYGYGHGVGMSQTGANELAKLGKDYQYILNYYYDNVDFKDYKYIL